MMPFHTCQFKEGVLELYISPCLCPPGTPADHMCIHESRLYVRRPNGAWHPIEIKSMHKAKALSELIQPGDSWEDVISALDVDPLPYGDKP